MSGRTSNDQEVSNRRRTQRTARVVGVLVGVVVIAGGLWLAGGALGVIPMRLAAPPLVAFLGGAFVVLIGFVFFGCATGIIVGQQQLNRLFGAIAIVALFLVHRVALFGESRTTIPGLSLLGDSAVNVPTYLVLAVIDGLIAVEFLRKFMPSLYRRLAPAGSVTEDRRLWLGASMLFFLLLWAGAFIGLYGPLGR